ncbi:MAG: alpha/beta hydrolase [Blastocatellia bacterium]|nr:alpha/beta hydrolase [Blastocatellia bacterium]
MKYLALALIAISLWFLPQANTFAGEPKQIAGHWEGAITREGKEWRVCLDISVEGKTLKGTVDLPDYGFYYLPLSIKVEGARVSLSHFLRSSTVSVDGRFDGDRITGTWKGLNLTADFQVKRTSVQPVVFAEEEVRCQSGDATLVGTLVKPNRPGRHPVIVFTHGSGNQTRSRSAYRSMAYMFARRGIAALIYDRRGMGASTGDSRRNLNMPVLADDAVAWVKALQLRDDINPRQIGVSGLSQGGWVSPLAAARSKDVAFVLVISAAGITIGEQDDFVAENLIRAKRKIPEGRLEGVLELVKRVREFARTGRGDPTALEAEIARLRGEPWFEHAGLPKGEIEQYNPQIKEFLSFDPVPVWKKVSVPVLALWGERDTIVPAEKSRAIIERALKEGGNKEYTLKIFPQADHQMYVVREEGAGWDWPRLAPGYQEAMIEWLLARVDVAK